MVMPNNPPGDPEELFNAMMQNAELHAAASNEAFKEKVWLDVVKAVIPGVQTVDAIACADGVLDALAERAATKDKPYFGLPKS